MSEVSKAAAFSVKFLRAPRSLLLALSTLLLAPCFSAEAQQTAKVYRLGYLTAAPLSAIQQRVEAFRQGLRELGYIEGKNIVIEYRSPEGKLDRLSELAAEFVRLKVDIIVTAGSGATRPAKRATTTIPIVMTQDDDPVGSGFVASLAHPGTNITGLSTLSPETSGKRLELLKETVARLFRVAVVGTSTSSAHARYLKEVELAAGTLGVKLQYLDVLYPRDIETTFRDAVKGRADAVLWLAGGQFNVHRPQIVELAVKSRLPAIYERRGDVEAGGLMSYGVYLPDLDRRAATYVDKILKGMKPGELPVEQATKFELLINLKAAKQIVLTIPPNVLARADRVIR
jgi:putative tryptophan/tyrosine transport system substrate-binding protein